MADTREPDVERRLSIPQHESDEAQPADPAVEAIQPPSSSEEATEGLVAEVESLAPGAAPAEPDTFAKDQGDE